MNGILKHYMHAGGMTILSKFFAFAALFAEIYLLNAMIGKSGYGEFVYAFTLLTAAGIVIANPLRSLILHKTAALSDRAAKDFVRGCLGLSFAAGLILACIAAALLIPALWFGFLCWILPFDIARILTTAYLQSRQDIPTMSFFQTILPLALRIVLLACLWGLDLAAPFAITAVYAAGFVIPSVIVMKRYALWPALPRRISDKSAVQFTAALTATQAVHQLARIGDLLFVGILLSASLTAEYAVAMKFAIALMIGKQMTEGLLTPRIGVLGPAALEKEYAAGRSFAFLTAIAGILGFTLFGPFILPLFGDYGENSYRLFFLLAAANLCRVATGSSSEYLMMKGHAAWIFGISLATAAATLSGAFFLISVHGAAGAAMAAVIGAATANAGAVFACRRTENFTCLAWRDIIIAAAFIALCLALGRGFVTPGQAGTGMIILAALFLLCEKRHLQNILAMVKQKR